MNQNSALEQLNLLKGQVKLLKNQVDLLQVENKRLRQILKQILKETRRTINLLN